MSATDISILFGEKCLWELPALFRHSHPTMVLSITDAMLLMQTLTKTLSVDKLYKVFHNLWNDCAEGEFAVFAKQLLWCPAIDYI